MANKLFQNGGFTIFESILSTVVLGTGLLGIAVVMQNNLSHSVQSDLSSAAVTLAQEKIETIMADHYYKGYEFIADIENYDAEPLSGGFTRSVTITEVSSDDLNIQEEGSGLNKIEVQVEWGEEESHSIKVSTIVAEVDL